MSFYNRLKKLGETLFTKHLFLTNTTLGVVFMGCGDAIQQKLEMKLYPGKVYERNRTENMMISGFGFGIFGHFWYKFLDSKFPGPTSVNICKKLAAEMVIGPPFMLAYFIAIGYLEKKPVHVCIDDFKKNIKIILAADWLIYCPLQGLNFLYIPPKYRFLYVCALCMAYDVFLSYITHKESNKAFAIKQLSNFD